MASSDFASADDLRKWTDELSDAAKSYDPAAGLAGTDTRLQMISRAEDIIRGLTDPSFTGHVYVSRVGKPNLSFDTSLTLRNSRWSSLPFGR